MEMSNFLDKNPENLNSSLKQERKDYEKLVSMHVPTLREHNLVSWWISLLFHCIQYTSSVARVQICKAKSYLVVFNSQIVQSFTIFFSHWLWGSLWSGTVDTTFIKGCWIIENVHIGRWDVSNIKTNCLVHTQLDLCDTVQANFYSFAHNFTFI